MSDFDKGKIDFIGQTKYFMWVSIAVVCASLFIIVGMGMNYGIDFAGGTEVQIKFGQQTELAQVRKVADDLGIKKAFIQSFGDANEFLVRFQNPKGKSDAETNKLVRKQIDVVTDGFRTQMVSSVPDIRRIDSVGPTVGEELKRNGLLAAFYSLIMILIYIGLRFDYKYAPGAVFALFHDAIITLGILTILGKEINVQIMAAILTIIGYSLNDTIVNFDRVRENEKIFRDQIYKFVVNRSVNDVLSRTILTSVTTMLAVVALFLFAGGVIKDFALTLGIGVFVGTYSSIYVASPILIWMDQIAGKKA